MVNKFVKKTKQGYDITIGSDEHQKLIDEIMAEVGETDQETEFVKALALGNRKMLINHEKRIVRLESWVERYKHLEEWCKRQLGYPGMNK